MFNTEKKLYNIDFNKVTELYNANEASSSRRNVKDLNKFSTEIVEKIIENVIINLRIDESETAWILITAVLQLGGSNQKAGNLISFTVNQHTLTAQQLNKIIRKTIKNGTNRQLARSIANEVAQIAISLNIPGDLHSQMSLEYPNLSDTEKVWCSNFQTQNPNCPDLVRDWLVKNYKSRFNR